MRRTCVICALLAGSPAQAGGLVVAGGGSPRTVGRAGTGVVGDDGGGALIVNPAAMARREGKRAQLGVTFLDDELAWQSDNPDAPIARDQSESSMAPLGAAIGSVGSWVIGIGAMTTAVSARTMRPPSDLTPETIDAGFDFRYAGIRGAARRDTVSIGVAHRIGESFALGVAFGASRVTITEVRRLWAGFSGRDSIGDPALDVEVGMSGVDRFAPSVVAGVLIAPEDSRIELGGSVTLMAGSDIDADAAGFGTRPKGPTVPMISPSARLHVDQPWIVRAGGRYVGERVVVELGGELEIMPASAVQTAWSLEGMRVVDRTGVDTDLTQVSSRISMRSFGAIRGAIDVELIGGFLWATTGYAYTVGSVPDDRQSPIFGDLGGHTFAVGLEGSAGGFTFTFGWSRQWSAMQRAASSLTLDNPFNAGNRKVPSGSYDGSSDMIGILLDVEMDAP